MRRVTSPNSTIPARMSAMRFARRAALPILAVSASVLVMMNQSASAGIVPTVPLLTSANFSVIGAQSVSNTGPSTLAQSLGLSPGNLSSITGFPPGQVVAPGTIYAADGVALQAQNDLTAAYINAANRPVEFTQVNPDLVGQRLAPGVYAGSSKAPLSLTGQLVLDGQGNNNAVFIFQTDSTLITGSGSSVALINGASECNVFWQVGSSATLATGSVFVGNILALTSITVQTGVVVHGRALARNGSVTLDNDVFTEPSCVPSTESEAPATTTTIDASAPTTAAPGGTPTTVPGGGVTPTLPGTGTGDTTPFNVTDITLPRTGGGVGATPYIGMVALALGAGALMMSRRRRPA